MLDVDNMLNTNIIPTLDRSTTWESCLVTIREKVESSTFETWFSRIDFNLDAHTGIGTVSIPNQFIADFIETQFGKLIEQTLLEHGFIFTTLVFSAENKGWASLVEHASTVVTKAKMPESRPQADSSRQFHPAYTFEKYVIGENNRMAHAAALAVAEAPSGTTFNPLIIYGGTGLGKTHLLQAIGAYALKEGTAERVVYLTSEEFTNQYISYVVHKKDSTSFYKKFMDIDLLIIDDIQFFSGKPSTQKEFFRIFNKLLLENKQIILSSDRAPDKITDMMTHIINRFMGGLITDIQPPNLETRMAILRKKADIDGILLPADVVEFLAHHITSNVRELEGILIKLIASSSFSGRDITLQIAKEICGDLIARKDERISVKGIQQKVAEFYGISPNQLNAHTRKRESTHPRYVAMYLCKKLTRQSLRMIGLDFGGRDYSTIIHACKKIEEDLLKDEAFKNQLAVLEEQIMALAG